MQSLYFGRRRRGPCFLTGSNSGGVSWILVGLGNPGKQYESTRHNMGWLALDSLMEMENFKLSKLRFKAWTGIFGEKRE